MSHWLFLPDDALHDLDTLASLSPDRIERLRDFLDSGEFELRYRVYVKVADLLDLTDEVAAKLCTFISYVQTQREKNDWTGQNVLEEFEYFLRKVSVEPETRDDAKRILEQIQEKKSLLAKVFSNLPDYKFSEKVRRLETGPVPHLHGFRAYCDVRPVYSADAEEIVDCFPVITLALVTHSTKSDETREVLVQLTEKDLEEFRQQFDRLDKKLAKLKDRCKSLVTRKKGGS